MTLPCPGRSASDRARPGLPRPAQAYLWFMAVAAIGLLLFWWQAWPGPALAGAADPGLMTLLVLLGVLAQHFPLAVSPKRKVDLSIAVYFACLLLFGALTGMALVGLSQLLGQWTLVLRRDPGTGKRLRTPRSALFNTSQLMVATGVGGLAYFALAPQARLERVENLWAIPVAAAAMYLANTWAVALMIGLQRGQNPATVWRSGRRLDALEFAGLFVAGLVTALLSIHYPWAPLLVLLPPALLHLSLKQTLREQDARVEAEATVEKVRYLQSIVEREQATLAATMASMSDGLLVLDAAHRVRYCNPHAGALFGIDPSGVIGQSAETLISQMAPSCEEPEAGRLTLERLIRSPQQGASAETTIAGPPRRDVLVTTFWVFEPAGASLGLVLRDVTDSKVVARLKERERIAMDLHDGVIQSLYALALGLGARERALDGDVASARHALRHAVAQINAVIQQIRDYIYDLRPQELGAQGICSGLRALAEELRLQAVTRPELELDENADGLLGPEAVTHLLHIAREATSNVVRHAGASAVTIRLRREGDAVALAIRDNGRGFDPQRAASGHGHGLRNMQERVRGLGGRLMVTSAPGSGAEVRLVVPVHHGAAAWMALGDAERYPVAGGAGR